MQLLWAAAGLVAFWFLHTAIPGSYHVRMFFYLMRAFLWDSRLKTVDEESVLSFRAHLPLCDWNWHLNNAMYNSLTDFARYAHLARMFKRVDLAGANGGVYMRFKRPIAPLEAFTIRTRVAGYDEKWLFIEHRFIVDGRCRACGVVKIALTGSRPIDALRSAFGSDCSLPPFAPGKYLIDSEAFFGRDLVALK